MGWDGESAGGGEPSHRGGTGINTPEIFCGQNLAFWCVSGDKVDVLLINSGQKR